MNNCGRFSRSIGSIYFVELLTELFDFTVGHIEFVWVFIQLFWSFGQFTMKLVNWFSLYAPSFGQVRGHSLVGRWWTTIGSPFWSSKVSEQWNVRNCTKTWSKEDPSVMLFSLLRVSVRFSNASTILIFSPSERLWFELLSLTKQAVKSSIMYEFCSFFFSRWTLIIAISCWS